MENVRSIFCPVQRLAQNDDVMRYSEAVVRAVDQLLAQGLLVHSWIFQFPPTDQKTNVRYTVNQIFEVCLSLQIIFIQIGKLSQEMFSLLITSNISLLQWVTSTSVNLNVKIKS